MASTHFTSRWHGSLMLSFSAVAEQVPVEGCSPVHEAVHPSVSFKILLTRAGRRLQRLDAVGGSILLRKPSDLYTGKDSRSAGTVQSIHIVLRFG